MVSKCLKHAESAVTFRIRRLQGATNSTKVHYQHLSTINSHFESWLHSYVCTSRFYFHLEWSEMIRISQTVHFRPCFRCTMGRMAESSLKRWESENCTRASGDTMNLSKLWCHHVPPKLTRQIYSIWNNGTMAKPCQRMQKYVNVIRVPPSQGTAGMLWSFAWANFEMKNNSSHFNPFVFCNFM